MPPYYVYDASRQIAAPAPREQRLESREPPRAEVREPIISAPLPAPAPACGHTAAAGGSCSVGADRQLSSSSSAAADCNPAARRRAGTGQCTTPAAGRLRAAAAQPAPRQFSAPAPAKGSQPAEVPTAMQQSIARIYEACQAPALSPPEYRVLFDCMAQEITANGLTGAQTLANIAQRAQIMGVEIRRDDVRFVLEVVSEADPWFEQGASIALFASRFRNFVVARCRGQGLNLSLDELDLIESWFTVPGTSQRSAPPAYARPQRRLSRLLPRQRSRDRSNPSSWLASSPIRAARPSRPLPMPRNPNSPLLPVRTPAASAGGTSMTHGPKSPRPGPAEFRRARGVPPHR